MEGTVGNIRRCLPFVLCFGFAFYVLYVGTCASRFGGVSGGVGCRFRSGGERTGWNRAGLAGLGLFNAEIMRLAIPPRCDDFIHAIMYCGELMCG